MSRIKNPQIRESLEIPDEEWSPGLVIENDEKKARQEYDWLSNKNHYREYLFVKQQDVLDDDVPWLGKT